MHRTLIVCILSAGLVAGCSSDEPPEESGAWPPPTACTTLGSPADLTLAERTSAIPDTPAGQALGWALDVFNVFPEQGSADSLITRFSARTFDSVAADALAAEFERLGKNRPYSLVGFETAPASNHVVAVVGTTKEGYRRFTISTAPDGRIDVFLFERLEVPTTAVAPSPAAAPVPPAPPAPEAGEEAGDGAGNEAGEGAGEEAQVEAP